MNLKTLIHGLTLAGSVLFLSGAKDVAAPKDASAPKPALKIDLSPLNDGKSAAVLSYADVVEPVQKAVVSIYSSKTVRRHEPSYFRQFFGDEDRESKEEGLGSGVIVSPNGYILTNNHVVEGADELKVALADDREFKGKIVGTDPKTDVAVVKIDADNLPTITLADSDRLRVGDVVFAVGNPLDIGETVTTGIVSAKGRRVHLLDDINGYEDFIQTDAAINLGNSGGALVDARGRLVGINSAMMSTTNGSMGIGFAVPINLASSVMQSLIATGTVARGYLGVGVDMLTPELAEAMGVEAKGMVISTVTADSPAAKAGLKKEDVIVAINGKPVESFDALRLIIAQSPPGTKVKVRYLREGKPVEVEIALTKLADDTAKPDEFIAGVMVAKVDDDQRSAFRLPDEVDGLVVTDVASDSPFGERFHTGMVIVQLNRTPVDDVAGARALLRPGRNFCLVWDRGGFRYVPFKNGE
jgi:serine protease Do/serine protease DegQ